MKKIIRIIALLSLIGVVSKAQDTMFVHQKGGILTKIATDKIDSILFKTSDLSIGSTIKGLAQKGPFLSGSSITVFDLQSTLAPSGKSFSEQITDNKGSFELDNLSLSSNYVSIRTDGFYFNEVSGKQSTSQITLLALSDISGKSNLNINLLTHLEKARVEYLMKAGKSFSESKVQAQKEVLAIFNIEKNNMKVSENLTITEQGTENGILLAISSMIQGYRTESEMTELLSNISNDIKTDGILNDATLGSALLNHAVVLDTVSIRNNLIKRYNDIGATSDVPYFGKYITNFISKTKFVITQTLVTYPEIGLNGDNILSLTKNTYISGTYITGNHIPLSFRAELGRGVKLKIKITSLSADTIFQPATDTTAENTLIYKYRWYITNGSGINWTIGDFNTADYTQTFTAIEPDKPCDLIILFEKGPFLVEYFEMNSTIPTWKKIITCKLK